MTVIELDPPSQKDLFLTSFKRVKFELLQVYTCLKNTFFGY